MTVSNEANDPAEYRTGDVVTVRDVTMCVKDRMTAYEMDRCKERAERLLDAIEGAKSGVESYPVEYLRAYGSQRRIGAVVGTGHDYLGNGVIVANIDGFDVEAVKPVAGKTDAVSLRFQEVSDE